MYTRVCVCVSLRVCACYLDPHVPGLALADVLIRSFTALRYGVDPVIKPCRSRSRSRSRSWDTRCPCMHACVSFHLHMRCAACA